MSGDKPQNRPLPPAEPLIPAAEGGMMAPRAPIDRATAVLFRAIAGHARGDRLTVMTARSELVALAGVEVSAMSVRRCFRPHVIEIARFLAPLISCCDTVSLFEEVNRRWPNLSFSDFLGAALEPRGAHDDPRTRSR